MMSDTDEEISYESADEGEGTKKKDIVSKKCGSMKNVPVYDQLGDSIKENETIGSKTPKEEEVNKPIAIIDACSSVEKDPNTSRSENKTEEGSSDQDTTKRDKEREVLENLADSAKSSWGWGNIGSWGSSVLNTAASSVTTLKSSVGEGFNQVMENMEYAFVEPVSEEEIAKAKKEKKENVEKSTGDTDEHDRESLVDETSGGDKAAGGEKAAGGDKAAGGPIIIDSDEPDHDGNWFAGWSSGLSDVVSKTTNIVQKTVKETSSAVQETSKTLVSGSKTLVTGSLDVLETIGKKTYNVIAEGDHGIKTTIKRRHEKTNLSLLLREAKDDADNRAQMEEEFEEERKSHFGAQFDDFQGLVQLEALEMLSNQCEGRVQSLLSSLPKNTLTPIKSDLVTVRDAFNLEDTDTEDCEDQDHEFDRLMTDCVGRLGVSVTPERLIHAQEKTRKWILNCSTATEDKNPLSTKEIHQAAIQSLAEFTARSIELFHRVSQLILMDKTSLVSSYHTRSTSLASGTRTICTEIGIMSTLYTQELNSASTDKDVAEVISPLITNIYLEATNSSTYIQDAFQLLLPVVQQGMIEAHQRIDPS